MRSETSSGQRSTRRSGHSILFTPILSRWSKITKGCAARPRFRNFPSWGNAGPVRRAGKHRQTGSRVDLYLAGYDHLNQSAIVSIVLEALFAHRSTLQNVIPPFQAVIEEAHNFIPSRQEGTDETPSLTTIRKVITEGRKFGTGLVLISQRPSRLDETTLAQCNSFLSCCGSSIRATRISYGRSSKIFRRTPTPISSRPSGLVRASSRVRRCGSRCSSR